MNTTSHTQPFFYYLICIFTILSIVSCKKADSASRIMIRAEQMLEQYPDSALTLLDSIANPYILNDKELNKYRLLQTEAIEHFKLAARHFHEAKNVKNEIISYKLIGNAFLMNSISDSAFYYYNKGLELAKANNDSLQIAKITQNMGIVYKEIGDYNKANEFFRKAFEYDYDSAMEITTNVYKTRTIS